MSKRRLGIGGFLLIFYCFAGSVFAQNAKIDSLTQLLSSREEKELVNVKLDLAKEYLSVSPEKTVELGKQALEQAIRQGKTDLESQANLTISSGLTYLGEFAKSKPYIDKGLTLAREIKNPLFTCTGLNALAAYYMNTGDYTQALSYFNESIKEANAAGLEKEEAMIRFNLGAIYTSMGKWSKGLSEFRYALEFFKKLGNKLYVSRTLMNIAVNYSSWGDFTTSLSYYEASLEYLQQVGDVVGEATVLNNIGEIYKDTKDPENAIRYYQKSLNLARGMNSKLHEAIPLLGIGDAFYLKQNFDLSEKYTRQALELFEAMQMAEGIARSNYVLGELSLERKNMNDAKHFATISCAIADSSGIQDLQEKVYLLLSKIDEQQGNISRSFDYFKQYAQVKDSLYNKNHSQQLAQLRSDLDLQDKENQIALLQKDNEIKDMRIKRQKNQALVLIMLIALLSALVVAIWRINKIKKKVNKMLVDKNKTIVEQHREMQKISEIKDLFLTIIGHDLRNPIGAFKDSLDQLADYPEMFPEEVRQQLISELRAEAANTYFLLDNLLVWARSQKDEMRIERKLFHVSDLVKNNVSLHIRQAESKQIIIKNEVADDCCAWADPNMVSLVLRNLISNAVKFTSAGGFITVFAKKKGDKLVEIGVTDTGVGISEKVKTDLFNKYRHTSTFGTNNEKGSGLGLMLCADFVRMNGGTIEVESTVGKGSTFHFTVPVSEA